MPTTVGTSLSYSYSNSDHMLLYLHTIGVWAVRSGSNDDDDGMTFNNTLVLSFVGQTR